MFKFQTPFKPLWSQVTCGMFPAVDTNANGPGYPLKCIHPDK